MLLCSLADLFVASGVVELDELAVFDDRVRHQNALAETFRDAFGERRFAVARRAVQKHATPGVDRGAELIEHFRFDMHVAERLFEVALLRRFGANRLGFDRDDVI